MSGDVCRGCIYFPENGLCPETRERIVNRFRPCAFFVSRDNSQNISLATVVEDYDDEDVPFDED